MNKLIGLLIIVLWLAMPVYASDLQQDIKQAIKSSEVKTVMIIESDGSGSGCIISKDGYIVTNAHVVHDNETVIVMMHDGHRYKADVISKSVLKDLAVVKIKAKDLPFFDIADSNDVYVGQFVIAIGYPLGEYSSTLGIISNTLESSASKLFYTKSDAAINPGNSGGPLIDLSGKLIAINDAIEEGANTISYSIPSNTLTDILPRLIAKQEIKQGFVGLTIQTLTPELAAAFKAPEMQTGVVVSDIRPESNAKKAGLEISDVIISANKRAMSNISMMITLVANMAPGSTLNLSILRDGKPMTISFIIQEAPKKKDEENE